jgi:fibro-slime domain-containing protein
MTLGINADGTGKYFKHPIEFVLCLNQKAHILFADALKHISAAKVGAMLGLFAALEWIEYNFDVDPPVLPFKVNVPITFIPSNIASHNILVEQNIAQNLRVKQNLQNQFLYLDNSLKVTCNDNMNKMFPQTHTIVFTNGVTVNSDSGILNSGSARIESSSETAFFTGITGSLTTGHGQLSFYSPSTTDLGASGNWQTYEADLVGDLQAEITTDGLFLNGQLLPYGKYSIESTSAKIKGSGLGAAPNFVKSVMIDCEDSKVVLGASGKTLSLDGRQIDLKNGLVITGFKGTAEVTSGDIEDTIILDGTFGDLMQISGNPSILNTNQSTPVSFDLDVQTSLTDTYSVTIEAPEGWQVEINDSGAVTATPAPGIHDGEYIIRIIAKSVSKPNLIASGNVVVNVDPVQPGMELTVRHDPNFTIPVDLSQLPAAFTAEVKNLGAEQDTYLLSFESPDAFELTSSVDQLTIPGGHTGSTGFYLKPVAGLLPPAGTELNFTVTASSTSDSAIIKTVTETFIVPELHDVVLTLSQDVVNIIPGTVKNVELEITSVGNVDEELYLDVASASNVSVSGLPSYVSIAMGETITIPISVAIPEDHLLNDSVRVNFVADLCNGITPESCSIPQPATRTVTLILNVETEEVVLIENSSDHAYHCSGSDISDLFKQFANLLKQLRTTPDDNRVYERMRLIMETLTRELGKDKILNDFIPTLKPIQDAIDKRDALSIFADTPEIFNDVHTYFEECAKYHFTMRIIPNQKNMDLIDEHTFILEIINKGSEPSIINLAFSAPEDVDVELNQPTLLLQPGEVRGVTSANPILLTLKHKLDRSLAYDVELFATASEASYIYQKENIHITARPSYADVVNVMVAPSMVESGTPITVQANIFNTANTDRDAIARLELLNENNISIIDPIELPVHLPTGGDLISIYFDEISTEGILNGIYTVKVSLWTTNDEAIPGESKQATIMIGIPVYSFIQASPEVVPPGTSAVETIINISNHIDINNSDDDVKPNEIYLTGTIRDFLRGDRLGGHPDFQLYTSNSSRKGLVQSKIGSDRKPVLSATQGVITSEETFNQWYRDVPNVNTSKRLTLKFTRVNNVYTYDEQSFFPIDNELFGNEDLSHNYHFTFELHTEFVYEVGQVFSFRGDDDVWVFINDILVIDLGGVHPAESASIDLDTLDLIPGNTYKLDLFFAERRTTQSSFRIETGINLFQNTEMDMEVLHTLTDDGYYVNESSLIPVPLEFNTKQIMWNITSQDSGIFYLKGMTPNMNPGEVRPISKGTYISSAIKLKDEILSIDIELPPLTVAAKHIINIDPPSQTVTAGQSTKYTVSLENPLEETVIYHLEPHGLNDFSVDMLTSVEVAPKETVQIDLEVFVPLWVEPSTNSFTILVESNQGAVDSVGGELRVIDNPVVNAGVQGIHIELEPKEAIAGRGTTAHLVARVTNVGNDTLDVKLSDINLDGITSNWSEKEFRLLPGLYNAKTVSLTMTPVSESIFGIHPFNVTAESKNNPNITDSDQGTLYVNEYGVNIELNPKITSPSSVIDMIIQNTGIVDDIYHIGLTGSASFSATPEKNTVQLSPGDTEIIKINIGEYNSYITGSIDLIASATSFNDENVKDTDYAQIIVSKHAGLVSTINLN